MAVLLIPAQKRLSHGRPGFRHAGWRYSNDKAAFDRIWGWTDKTLRNKDNGLFYWRFNPVEPDPIADKNDATDERCVNCMGVVKSQSALE